MHYSDEVSCLTRLNLEFLCLCLVRIVMNWGLKLGQLGFLGHLYWRLSKGQLALLWVNGIHVASVPASSLIFAQVEMENWGVGDESLKSIEISKFGRKHWWFGVEKSFFPWIISVVEFKLRGIDLINSWDKKFSKIKVSSFYIEFGGKYIERHLADLPHQQL